MLSWIRDFDVTYQVQILCFNGLSRSTVLKADLDFLQCRNTKYRFLNIFLCLDSLVIMIIYVVIF